MKRSSRLSITLHILLHMNERKDEGFTSESIAGWMDTNAVVIRRTLAGLREAGLVSSEKGHGGGWRIACDLTKVSLGDIYRALDEPLILFQENRTEHPKCLVEQAVNQSLDSAFEEAHEMLMKKFNSVKISDLSADFHQRMKKHGHTHHKK